jgi:hypothetical protein
LRIRFFSGRAPVWGIIGTEGPLIRLGALQQGEGAPADLYCEQSDGDLKWKNDKDKYKSAAASFVTKAADSIATKTAGSIEVEQRAEARPATGAKLVRKVVVDGLRSNQLLIEKEGTTTIFPQASTIYLSQLAAAIEVPIILSPGLLPLHVSDTVAFQDTFLPTVAAYLKEVEIATKIINGKFPPLADVLGNPISEVEFGGKDYDIAFRKYEHGAIYVPPGAGPFEVHGAIYQKYLALGAETSFLGVPETDELSTTFNTGRFNHFRGGSIYWSPQTGAWSIHGAFRDRWFTLDAERGYLGFPISDVERGQVAYFDRGNLRIQSDGSIQDYPDSVILTPSINGGEVKCTTEFWMNSKGSWRYKGHLHND